MITSKKIKEYFVENEGKSKEELIDGLIAMGYKERAAKAFYTNKDTEASGTTKYKLAFDFFAENPLALIPMANDNVYAKELGLLRTTYSAYKYMYINSKSEREGTLRKKLDREELKAEKKVPLYGEKYFKGRLRQKFKIDDSRL